MFPFIRFAEGLCVAHFSLLASFLIGSVAIPWLKPRDTLTAAGWMMRIVCACGMGYALIGISAFMLAELGVFNPAYLIGTCVILFLAGAMLWKEYPWTRSFWAERFGILRACWTFPLFIVYCVMVAVAIPAVLPNVGGDPIHYHLAYAQDWVASGSLVIDPFLRYPFWVSNFVLLYAIVLAFHGAAFINFLTWSLGLLSALGICAIADDALGARARGISRFIPLLVTLAVILPPMYMRWVDSAYMDVPSGAFAQIFFTCIYIACAPRRGAWLFGAAITGAFLIGMKPSYVLLVPIFILGIISAGRHLQISGKMTVYAIVLLVTLASPWYLRNLVLAGDPVAPVLNVALYGNDGFTSGVEWQRVQSDLSNTPKLPWSLFSVPYRAFVAPNNRTFREYGVSALLLYLYVMLAYMLLTFGRKQTLNYRANLCALILAYLTAYWLLTSSILRYSLLFYPLLAICAALCIAHVLEHYPRAAIALTALSLLAIVPSPGSKAWYTERAVVYYRHLSETYTSDDTYLRLNDNGYAEERATAEILRRRGIQGVVYTLGGDTDYFFRQDHLVNAGDWIGPGGYFRLYGAIDAGEGAQFVRGLGASAVLIDPQFALGGLDKPFEVQLLRAGFCGVPLPQSRYKLLLTCSPR